MLLHNILHWHLCKLNLKTCVLQTEPFLCIDNISPDKLQLMAGKNLNLHTNFGNHEDNNNNNHEVSLKLNLDNNTSIITNDNK